ncbi:MAG: hypothetical protein DSZ21_00100 [Tenericutes bacterium]|nr:MAG: hypothetical protein DSZ21_00100 [Mycoplasmatota bacterium]
MGISVNLNSNYRNILHSEVTLTLDDHNSLVANLEVAKGQDISTISDDVVRDLFAFSDSDENHLSGSSITIDRSSLTATGGTIRVTATDSKGHSLTISFVIRQRAIGTITVQEALNNIPLSSVVTGQGAAATIKDDLSSLETGVLEHFDISARISTPAIDGTKNSPQGSDGQVIIAARPKEGFALSTLDGALIATINIPKINYIDRKVFDNKNDLINAVKGLAENASFNVHVGEYVQVGSNGALIEITQEKFDELKMENSYKGTFSSDAQRDAFKAITTQVSDNQFKDENNLTFISLPKATDIGANAFQFTKVDAIDLPEVTSIGTAAFGQARELHEIDLPKVETIAQNAFANCPATSLKIPQATTIADNAFKSIDNKSSTHATLNAKFNTSQ